MQIDDQNIAVAFINLVQIGLLRDCKCLTHYIIHLQRFIFILLALYNMGMDRKRLALFLIGCIGTRLALVSFAHYASPSHLRYMGYAALLPAFGFLYFYLTGTRKTGPEVFGEAIWWNDLRPVHSALYALFASMAIYGNSNAFWVLFADVLFGLGAFTWHHFVK
jgi:hypothetical protein